MTDDLTLIAWKVDRTTEIQDEMAAAGRTAELLWARDCKRLLDHITALEQARDTWHTDAVERARDQHFLREQNAALARDLAAARGLITGYADWVHTTFPIDTEQNGAEQALLDYANSIAAAPQEVE